MEGEKLRSMSGVEVVQPYPRELCCKLRPRGGFGEYYSSSYRKSIPKLCLPFEMPNSPVKDVTCI